MKKIVTLLLVLAVLASVVLLSVSVSGAGDAVLTVAELAKQEYARGDTVEIPTYTVESAEAYTADVIAFLPNGEIIFLSHEENGSITSYINNKTLCRASFGVSDTSFCAEMKGEYTLRYVVYTAKTYERTVCERTFTVN